MRKWIFENGIEVYESDYNFDLHCLKVYNGEEYLGTVYPDNIKDMESCFDALNSGDPITSGWEDGCGNSCTLDGWGD